MLHNRGAVLVNETGNRACRLALKHIVRLHMRSRGFRVLLAPRDTTSLLELLLASLDAVLGSGLALAERLGAMTGMGSRGRNTRQRRPAHAQKRLTVEDGRMPSPMVDIGPHVQGREYLPG